MTPETVAEVALDILNEKGWNQGAYEGKDGSVCVAGALMAAQARTIAQGLGPAGVVVHNRAVQLLGLPPASISVWNDDPHTTFEDVTLVLKRVAAGEGVE
jgi:hypothetical protein